MKILRTTILALGLALATQAQTINVGLNTGSEVNVTPVRKNPNVPSDPMLAIWYLQITLNGTTYYSTVYTNPVGCQVSGLPTTVVPMTVGQLYHGKIRIAVIQGSGPAFCYAGSLNITNVLPGCLNFYVDQKYGSASFDANIDNARQSRSQFEFTYQLRPTTNAYPIATWTASKQGQGEFLAANMQYFKMTADGKSKAQAYLRQGYTTNTVTFSFAGESLGCTLTADGVLKAGTNHGTVHVVANTTDTDPCLIRDFFFDLDKCGNAKCANCGSQGDTRTSVHSVDVQIAAGTSYIGGSAGYLQVKEDAPSTGLGTPATLRYAFQRPDVTVVTNGNGNIQQVQSPDGYINVAINTSSSYSLQFFRYPTYPFSTNSLYPTDGTPYKTVTLENVSGDTNHFRVTDSNKGVLADYYWLTNGWSMTTGGGLRNESIQESWNGNQKTTIRQIRDSNGQLDSQTIETWEGNNLLSQVVGNGTEAHTNNFSYDTNGNVLQGLRSDGSWEINQYDAQGRLTAQYRPFLNSEPTTNSSLCRLTTYGYDVSEVSGSGDNGSILPNVARSVKEYALGQEVSRRYTVLLDGVRKDLQCVNPGAAWNNASNLMTTTWFYQNALYNNKPSKISQPDGVVETFSRAEQTAYQSAYYSLDTQIQGFTNSSGSIVRGTKTDEYRNLLNYRLAYRVTTDVASGLTIGREAYYYDQDGHLTNTVYLDGTQATQSFDCCHLQSSVDRMGVATAYSYDALDRQSYVLRDGVTTWTEYSPSGNILKTHRIGSDSSDILTSQATYDSTGQLLSNTDAVNRTTAYTNWMDVNGQTVRMTTNPDNGTRIEVHAKDGRLVQISGTAVYGSRYEYGVEQIDGVYREFTKEIKLNSDESDSAEWTKTWRDGAGQQFRTTFADSTSQNSYFSGGKLVRQVDADGVTTLFQYDPWGNAEFQAIDVNQNGVIDTNGTDRITRTLQDTGMHGANVVSRRQVLVYTSNSSTNQAQMEMSETAVDSLQAWNTKTGVTSRTVTVLQGNGARTETTTAQEGAIILKSFQGDRLTSLTVSNINRVVTQEAYQYDSHNRLWKKTDVRNGATTLTYNDADQIATVTTPTPSTGGNAQATTTVYDSAGRAWIVQQPDGGATTNEYYLTGTLKKSYGARTYPVEYTYDFAGRLNTLKTWKSFATDGGSAVTTWNYSNRGLLTSKVYPDGQGPTYTFTSAGRPKTRVWARGVSSTNVYNTGGDLVSISYSDSTPKVTIGYDRPGRPTSIQGGTTNTLTYSGYGQVQTEDIRDGRVNYLSQLRYGYNANAQLQSLTNQTLGYVQSFLYSGIELTGVASDSRQAVYSYINNSSLIGDVAIKQGASTVFETVKNYDNLNRLSQIVDTSNRFGAAYSYNAANQRTAMGAADGSFWNYGYDFLGQVTNGNRFWADSSHVAGQQFEYAFDDIGNRTGTKVGGDASGTNLRPATYNVNVVNQITNRTVPGFIEVSGDAANGVDVSVAGTAPGWQGNYFRQEVQVDNSAASVFTNIPLTVTSLISTSVVARAGLVAQNPETFQYDADGNLIQDGQWAYTWDAENRLVGMQALTNAIPAELRLKLDFSYDFTGRRITKSVSRYNPSNGQWQLTSRKKFFYDGWNLIGEQDEVTGARISYTWGLDLSQTRQGAGGVGGLLWLTVYSGSSATSYATAYDGNGNVIGLVNTATGSTAAQYEYGPFGELLRLTGPAGKANPFRFSSKYQDDETGLVYYGFRYYEPSTGSWVSRDPIGEQGELNLRGFVGNDAINACERNGLDFSTWIGKPGYNFAPSPQGTTATTPPDPNQPFIKDPTQINCIGFACDANAALFPKPTATLLQAIEAQGYKCKTGTSALECGSCKCAQEAHTVMIYVYMRKDADWAAIRRQVGNRDVFTIPWGQLRGPPRLADYHGLRGLCDGGGYRYQSMLTSRSEQSTTLWGASAEQPDYFPPQQLLGKACCEKTH